MSEQTGYKIVEVLQSGDYCSCTFNPASQGVIYKLNEVTRPKDGNGPLILFRQLEDALAHYLSWYRNIRGIKRYAVLKCQYEKSEEKDSWYLIPSRDGSLKTLSGIPKSAFPDADLADWIHPIERCNLETMNFDPIRRVIE